MFGSPSIFLDVKNFGNYSTIFYIVRERFVAVEFNFVLNYVDVSEFGVFDSYFRGSFGIGIYYLCLLIFNFLEFVYDWYLVVISKLLVLSRQFHTYFYKARSHLFKYFL